MFLYLKKFSEISWSLIEYRLLYSDANAVKREEEAIKVDELNVAQIKELRDKVRLVLTKRTWNRHFVIEILQ